MISKGIILISKSANSWFIGKVPDAGKDWGQKEKRAPEDEMAGWLHWCNGHKPVQTSSNGEGHRGLVCFSPLRHKDLDTTVCLNNNNNIEITLWYHFVYLVYAWKEAHWGLIGLFEPIVSTENGLRVALPRSYIVVGAVDRHTFDQQHSPMYLENKWRNF